MWLVKSILSLYISERANTRDTIHSCTKKFSELSVPSMIIHEYHKLLSALGLLGISREEPNQKPLFGCEPTFLQKDSAAFREPIALVHQGPWPPNISDEHVFCIAPAMRNASFQILFKCPTPTIVFGNTRKRPPFARFWQGAQSLAPATWDDIWTSKSGSNMWCF